MLNDQQTNENSGIFSQLDNNPGFKVAKKAPTIIKVVGVGGGGNNAVNHMYSQDISGISFVGMERIQVSGQLLERLKHGPGDLHPEAFLLSYGYLIICIAVQNILLHLLKQSAVQQPVYQRNEHIRWLFYDL